MSAGIMTLVNDYSLIDLQVQRDQRNFIYLLLCGVALFILVSLPLFKSVFLVCDYGLIGLRT